MNNLTLVGILFLFVVGCGGGDKNSESSVQSTNVQYFDKDQQFEEGVTAFVKSGYNLFLSPAEIQQFEKSNLFTLNQLLELRDSGEFSYFRAFLIFLNARLHLSDKLTIESNFRWS